MRPLPTRFFGLSTGLPCLFTVDDSTGATSSGYLIKQISPNKFIVSDGSTTKLCRLPFSLDEVSNTSDFAPSVVALYLILPDSTSDIVASINETRCSTLQGIGTPWHPGSPTATVAGLVPPVTNNDDILLESGGFWLLENGDFWELEGS